MALLNGRWQGFRGVSPTLEEVGEAILEGSLQMDGRNIVLELSEEEEGAFQRAGLQVGPFLLAAIAVAIEKRTGKYPEDLRGAYSRQVFTT